MKREAGNRCKFARLSAVYRRDAQLSARAVTVRHEAVVASPRSPDLYSRVYFDASLAVEISDMGGTVPRSSRFHLGAIPS